jgi:hypothetical protein
MSRDRAEHHSGTAPDVDQATESRRQQAYRFPNPHVGTDFRDAEKPNERPGAGMRQRRVVAIDC